jgi:hypothetical protein
VAGRSAVGDGGSLGAFYRLEEWGGEGSQEVIWRPTSGAFMPTVSRGEATRQQWDRGGGCSILG